MTRKVNARMLGKIHARRRAGLNQTQIARELGISQGTVSLALQKPPPALPRKASSSSSKKAPLVHSPAPTSRDDLREQLGKMIATITQLAEEARARQDPHVYLQFARVASQSIKELSRLMPPPPPDANDSPDVIAAADRAREKILERVRRAAKGNAA
jgi:predicted transcriptional regulator